jgi:hypothetical protein
MDISTRPWIPFFLSALLIAGILWIYTGVREDWQQQSVFAAAQSTNVKNYLPLVSKQPTPTPTPVPANNPPLTAPSYYMTTVDSKTVFNEGCALGKRDLGLAGRQDSVVILAFGYPQYRNGSYGTRGYSYPANPVTTSQIAVAVENFGLGYWTCVGEDFDSHLRIGVGTNNYPGDNYTSVSAGHGKAWAQMVNSINDWFVNQCERGCDGQVDAVGASDIELSWNSASATTDWVKGYESAARYPMYNFGAIEGCPYLKNPGYTCYWGDKEKVWYVIWGSAPVQPVPETYLVSGINAEQWYLMSVYSYEKHGQKIQFVGPMTELKACEQRGGCGSGDKSIANPPENAWKQLFSLLNGDSRTAGEALPFITDIRYLGE